MALQNFVDKLGPVISATWLNFVDQSLQASSLAFGIPQIGGLDISAALQTALNSGASFISLLPAANQGIYTVHDVTIPSGVTLFAPGVYCNDAPGAQWGIKLTGFNSCLYGLQYSNATNCAQGAIVVDDGNWCRVDGVRVINATTPFLLKSSSNGGNGRGCARTQLSNLVAVAFTGVGVDTAANVHDTQAVNIYCDSNTVAGVGGQIPRAGATGFRFVGTGSTVAFGGHQYTNCNAINMQTGWQFTDTNLIKLDNCIADSLSGIGYNLTGSTNQIDLDNCFAGVCAGAVVGAGTSAENRVRGLRSNAIGNIPGFGGSNWYSSAGFSAPFYDIQQTGTAVLAMDLDSWHAVGTNAHSFNEAVAQSIEFTGGMVLNFNSLTSIPTNTTTFLALSGNSATESGTQIIIPLSSVANALRIVIQADTAPGAGQSFTYNLRVNSVNTAITATTAGAGVFQATVSGGPVGINANASLSLRVTSSNGAAAAFHRAWIILIPQPS